MSLEFRALVVDKTADRFSVEIKRLGLDDLPAGGVLIQVAYSSVNFKDGLACSPTGNIVRKYPFVPGIDLSGIVVESSDPRFKPGDHVIATSYDIGVSHFGGFSEYARVKADWVLPLPEGLTLRESMILGTAGFTAGLALQLLERNGLDPSRGRVLVTGATGGVGSLAVNMLAGAGYEVTASTGKASEHAFLRDLGAAEVLSREDVSAESSRPLEKERWAAVIDSVGGATLSYAIRATRSGGAVAACGLTGGTALSTTVFPFILRGVSLLGVDSEKCPMPLRADTWGRLSTDLKPKALDRIGFEIELEDIPRITSTILNGGIRGRAVVRLSGQN
ncbi:MAG TPA: acryloyl-CoA reductase [Thermoflexales bacterium]|nr:acryloyl-CoA reductase [Thermoflexales bacterium]HQY25721.1 acryloyl-CoA reductase [Thermoflexales bacterium]HRA55059.1 acryloyl-CoA reductase [Thermoflexales bacterium]